MKTIKHTKFLATLGVAFAFALSTNPAQAGPSPELYRPVMTMQQAQSLPVGKQIAVSCGNCGGVSLLTVDQDRSYLRGYTCPMCKRVFHVAQPGGGGRAVGVGQFVYVDKADHVSHLSTR